MTGSADVLCFAQRVSALILAEMLKLFSFRLLAGMNYTLQQLRYVKI